MCKQDLLKVSQKEASLEAQASNLQCQLTDTQTCLEEVERRKAAIQVRSQELQQRLERYIDDEAKKHQELVQMMDRRMRMATVRSRVTQLQSAADRKSQYILGNSLQRSHIWLIRPDVPGAGCRSLALAFLCST